MARERRASINQVTRGELVTLPSAGLHGIRACVFDAYGTLFDFASAAARCGEVPREQAAQLTAIWRDKQLQYTWLRGLFGCHADFWQVTGDALDFALETTLRGFQGVRGVSKTQGAISEQLDPAPSHGN